MPQILEIFVCASGISSYWGCWLPSAVDNQIYLPFHVYQTASNKSFSVSIMLVSTFLISSSERLVMRPPILWSMVLETVYF